MCYTKMHHINCSKCMWAQIRKHCTFKFLGAFTNVHASSRQNLLQSHKIVLVNLTIFFLDLQKVQGIIRKHHQTFLQLFGMTYIVMQYCLMAKYHYVHNLWQSVRGGGGGGDSKHYDVLDIS